MDGGDGRHIMGHQIEAPYRDRTFDVVHFSHAAGDIQVVESISQQRPEILPRQFGDRNLRPPVRGYAPDSRPPLLLRIIEVAPVRGAGR
jgi:hypothetical protein